MYVKKIQKLSMAAACLILIFDYFSYLRNTNVQFEHTSYKHPLLAKRVLFCNKSQLSKRTLAMTSIANELAIDGVTLF